MTKEELKIKLADTLDKYIGLPINKDTVDSFVKEITQILKED